MKMLAKKKTADIIIIEDNKFIRSGWELMLDNHKEFGITGSYGSVEEAIANDNFSSADLIIIDLQLPGMSGVEGISYIKSRCPEATIVACTAYEDNEQIFDAIKAGAVGFIEKKAKEEEMLFFLRNAVNGYSPMSPKIARRLLSIQKENSLKIFSGGQIFCKSEIQILSQLAEGKSYSAAAVEININVDSLMKSINEIYKKLQNKIELFKIY